MIPRRISRPRGTRRHAVFAAIVTSIFVLILAVERPVPHAPRTPRATVGAEEARDVLLAAVRSGVLPPAGGLPAVYGDPSRLERMETAFTAPSPLVKQWFATPTAVKIAILGHLVREGDPAWLFVFLAEIAYLGIASEPDVGVAGLIRGAVHSTAMGHAPVAIFLLEHIERTCPHDVVRRDAGEDARDLRARVRALGH